MSELKFKQSKYAGQVFLPQGPQRATLVYVAGLPYSTGENTIIRWALSKGFAVVFPQAPGTYDSDGRFSVASYARLLRLSIEDVNGGRLKGARPDGPYIKLAPVTGLISHSFGTLTATRVFCQLQNLELLLMFSPLLDYTNFDIDVGVRENLSEQYDYVKYSRPHTFRLTRKELFIADAYQRVSVSSRNPSSRICAFAGAKDSDLDTIALANGFEKWAQRTFGDAIDARIHITASGGHSISSILDSDALKVLENVTETCL